MADAAVGQQPGADIGDPAEHMPRAEGGVEPVEMDQAVEERQYRRFPSDAGPDRLNRRVEVVMLGGQ